MLYYFWRISRGPLNRFEESISLQREKRGRVNLRWLALHRFQVPMFKLDSPLYTQLCIVQTFLNLIRVQRAYRCARLQSAAGIQGGWCGCVPLCQAQTFLMLICRVLLVDRWVEFPNLTAMRSAGIPKAGVSNAPGISTDKVQPKNWTSDSHAVAVPRYAIQG